MTWGDSNKLFALLGFHMDCIWIASVLGAFCVPERYLELGAMVAVAAEFLDWDLEEARRGGQGPGEDRFGVRRWAIRNHGFLLPARLKRVV